MSGGDDKHPLAVRFGRNVLRARKRADLSQEELRIRAALHRTQIGMVERGLRLPRLDTIVKLAGGIEADARELLEGMSWFPTGIAQGRFYVAEERRFPLRDQGSEAPE